MVRCSTDPSTYSEQSTPTSTSEQTRKQVHQDLNNFKQDKFCRFNIWVVFEMQRIIPWTRTFCNQDLWGASLKELLKQSHEKEASLSCSSKPIPSPRRSEKPFLALAYGAASLEPAELLWQVPNKALFVLEIFCCFLENVLFGTLGFPFFFLFGYTKYIPLYSLPLWMCGIVSKTSMKKCVLVTYLKRLFE